MKKEMYDYLGLVVPAAIDLDSLKPEQVESTDTSRAVLEAIYSLDPVTRLPTGDIMCYLASTTPPEVKQYIMDNIMIDTSNQKLPSLPDGLDEDTAFALERKNGESAEVYRSRISDYMYDQVRIRNMAIENAKRQASEPSE